MARVNRPGKFLTGIILFTIRKYLEYRSDIKVSINETVGLKPPYIIISNHVNNWDPFFINCYVNHPISFVASDRFFRNRVLKRLLLWTGAIPKTKFIPDFSTVKSIINAKKSGRVIGIFPEGNRNWDGNTGEILYSTAKLIKLLKIPVVVVKLKGAHLSHPRWANNHRKGKIIISLKKFMDKDEILTFSEDEVYKRIVDGLKYDEYGFQNSRMYSYRGKKLAENLELLLFTCSNCREIGHMKSLEDRLFCDNCGYSMVYNDLGFFEGDDLYFDNPRDYNRWQNECLKEFLINNDGPILLKDYDALLYRYHGDNFKMDIRGNIYLEGHGFYLIDERGNKKYFNIKQVDGINISSNNKIDFYYNNNLYRIAFDCPHVSLYKWMRAFNIVRKSLDEKNTTAIKGVNSG